MVKVPPIIWGIIGKSEHNIMRKRGPATVLRRSYKATHSLGEGISY